ncbi:MAG: ribosome-associated translation inhibitor RaiA [Planctomycetota bacterium]
MRDGLKEYAEQKAAKLERFLDQLQKIEVVLSAQGDEKMVEMICVPRRGDRVVGHATHEDPMAAVDLVIDKMTQQLKRLKEKRDDRKKRSGRAPAPPLPSDEVAPEEELESYQEVVDEFSSRFDEEDED